MSEDDCSSTLSESDARDWALPASNGKRSDAAYRNYMRKSKQRFLPIHKGRAVLNLAAQRWGKISPKPRAPYRKLTSMSVDLEPPYDAECGMKPKKRGCIERKSKGSCGKDKPKRSKSSSGKRRRRKSVAKKSKRKAQKPKCKKTDMN